MLFVAGAVFFFSTSEDVKPDAEHEHMIATTSGMAPDTHQRTTHTSPHATSTFTPNRLYGTWESIDDENFRRSFFANGTYRDAYAGAPFAETNGTWDTYPAGSTPDTFPFPAQAGAQYLELRDGQEVLYFTIARVSEHTLELLYLNRGGSLRFTKVTEE